MKTIITSDGTIGNLGDIQPDLLPMPDVSMLDPGVAPAGQPSFTLTSASEVAPQTIEVGISMQAPTQITLSTVSSAFAPLVITPDFGPSIVNRVSTTADPATTAQIETAIDDAINYLDTNWTSDVLIGSSINGTIVNTVSVAIDFGYGTLDTTPMTGGSGASESSYNLMPLGSFATVKADLGGSLTHLPASDPTGGGTFWLTTAQADLLGEDVSGTGVAGWVGLNSIANLASSNASLDFNFTPGSTTAPAGQIGVVGAMEHEITEVFGRISLLNANDGLPANHYSLMDLYRFTAPGTPTETAGASDYFSLNNGTTAAGFYNNNPANEGDAGDWDSSGANNVVADSFDAFLSTGTSGTIAALDTMVLSNIGFQPNVVPAPRTLAWTGAQSTAFGTAANWNDITDGQNPALSAPGTVDTAQFLNNGGSVTGTGTGTVAALEFGGNPLWNVASGASLSALSSVTVGQGGHGALLINGGASVTGLGAADLISGAAGSAASVGVDGLGSAWKSQGELTVGGVGGGSLTITGKASVGATATASLPAMVLGAAAGGSGTLSVAGAGSKATIAGQLDVGQSGSGQLQITGQGTVQTGGAAVAPSQGFDMAENAGGSGQVTVTGSQSLLSNTGAFIVGDAGLGGLSVLAGGTVDTSPNGVSGLSGLVVANAAGASGSSVNVSGSGSQLNVGGLLDVGASGSGLLDISSGATVTAGSLDAANVASAVGQIGLSGAGSALLVTGAATVADDGAGVLSVLSGATFTAQSLTIGSQGDSSGALVVSGNGSVVQLSGALNIGTALGIGDLTVGPGAAVHASVVNLQGQVVLEGGLLDPTVQLINQGQTVGGFGTIAAGDIVDEGVIQAGGNKASQKLLLVQGNLLGGGTLTVDGSQPGSNAAGILQINAGGTMELTGAVLNAATTTFTDNLTPTGTYTVNNSVVDVTFADAAGVLKLDDIAGFAGTITTFHAGDSFLITGGTLSNPTVVNGNTLTFADSGANAGAGGIDSIIFAAPVSAAGFNVVNNTVQVACFAEGTRIETVTGPVAVETLGVGDRAITADGGGAEPVIWIGQRTVDCARHPRPETVWPVRVRAGAFGENVPVRDLSLSPDHAVFVNNVLVPVKLLINGTTITQINQDRVRYFHVELPRHAVILAEGLTVESYLDTGDRSSFSNGGGAVALHPCFSARMWEAMGCAKLVVTGHELVAIRRRLEDRARVAGGVRHRLARLRQTALASERQ